MATAERLCAVCGEAGAYDCGGCMKVQYCGAEHQQLNWKKHRPSCAVRSAAPPYLMLVRPAEVVAAEEAAAAAARPLPPFVEQLLRDVQGAAPPSQPAQPQQPPQPQQPQLPQRSSPERPQPQPQQQQPQQLREPPQNQQAPPNTPPKQEQSAPRGAPPPAPPPSAPAAHPSPPEAGAAAAAQAAPGGAAAAVPDAHLSRALGDMMQLFMSHAQRGAKQSPPERTPRAHSLDELPPRMPQLAPQHSEPQQASRPPQGNTRPPQGNAYGAALRGGGGGGGGGGRQGGGGGFDGSPEAMAVLLHRFFTRNPTYLNDFASFALRQHGGGPAELLDLSAPFENKLRRVLSFLREPNQVAVAMEWMRQQGLLQDLQNMLLEEHGDERAAVVAATDIVSFYCPLSGDLMSDPVVDPEGHSYQRSHIEAWLRDHDTSPITGNPLNKQILAGNEELRRQIAECERASPLPARLVRVVLDAERARAESEAKEQPQLELLHAPATGPSEIDVLVRVHPPEGAARAGIDLVCVIDTSDSMGSDAELVRSDGSRKRQGFSVLDVIKHSLQAIVRTLRPQDRLAIVEFSNKGQLLMPLTPMDGPGQRRAAQIVSGLQPGGKTMLWEGVVAGLDAVQRAPAMGEGSGVRWSAEQAQDRPAALFLLTDGEPSRESDLRVDHDYGTALDLQKQMRAQQGLAGQRAAATPIHTWGFSYDIRTPLLVELAQRSGGQYAFISDAMLVAPVLSASLANSLSVCASRVVVRIEPRNGAVLVPPEPAFGGAAAAAAAPPQWTAGELPCKAESPGGAWQVLMGRALYGQHRDLLVRVALPRADSTVSVTVTAAWNGRRDGGSGGEAAPLLRQLSASDVRYSAPSAEVAVERLRVMLVEQLTHVCALADGGRLEEAQRLVVHMRIQMTESECKDDERVHRLISDVSGQIAEAVASVANWRRWGRSYLQSLQAAHRAQENNSAFDQGVQNYGGALFRSIRDWAADMFRRLPAAFPSNSAAGGADIDPAGIAAFQDTEDGGCFAGHCRVLLADGSLCRADALRRGDCVRAASGGVSRVAGVLCVELRAGAPLVALGSLLISPYHPVWDVRAAAWRFPCDLAPALRSPACTAVYSVALEAPSSGPATAAAAAAVVAAAGQSEEALGDACASVVVEGVAALALGHGLGLPTASAAVAAAAHPFFGTARVLTALAALPGWREHGRVRVRAGPGGAVFRRDAQSGLVAGFAADVEVVPV